MPDEYANNAQTTLNGAINAVQTSITVASATGFPPAADYRIVIDAEILYVTGGAGTTTWTVVRGAEGSTAASHSSGAAVANVLTAEVMNKISYNPRRACVLGTEFYGQYSFNLVIGTSYGVGSNFVYGTFADNEMGIIQCLTDVNNGDGILVTPPEFSLDFDDKSELLIRARTQTTTNQQVLIGLKDAGDDVISAGTSAYQIAFTIDTGVSSNYRVLTSDYTAASTADYSPTTAVDNQWHTFRIRRSGSSIFFRIDNQAEMERTSNIPPGSASILVAWGIRNLEAANKVLDISYWWLWRAGMSR